MSRFVVLLRGVNVGKNNRVPMAKFKALLEQLGYSDVHTLLNSGNAVFESAGRSTAKHARTIRQALVDALNVTVPVVVIAGRELAAIVHECPFAPPPERYSRFLIAFVQQPSLLEPLQELVRTVKAPEKFAVGAHAAYLYCTLGILESATAKALLGKAGREATTRNWATVCKLNALANP